MKLLVFTVIGGVPGFAYYKFIDCATSTCPLTSNPYTSTLYGIVIGVLLGWGQ